VDSEDKQKTESGVSSTSESNHFRPPATPKNTDNKPRTRDKWDKLEILLRPVAAFLTAITVALIGWFGQQVFDQRSSDAAEIAIIVQESETQRASDAEKEITRRTELSQNYRLYTELLSKREEAESALRKDMFSTILKEFFQTRETDSAHQNITKRLLKLEILALNFGETLSLSPLFVELDKDIENATYETDFPKKDKDVDRKRLQSLAKRVSDQQLAALATGGISWDFAIPIEELKDGNIFYWPENDMDYERTLEDIQRTYLFQFSGADHEYKSINVDLEIRTEGESKSIEQSFTLNFFNFPMVNNTRLPKDQRFSLIMTRFEKEYIHFSAVSFPGKYSSQRDKPFLDDVIHRLHSKTSKLTSKKLAADDYRSQEN
jgi:hypothetical protein